MKTVASIRPELDTLRRALGCVTDWTLAIDGGAHVGTWSAVMAERFGKVLAFEPTAETFALLMRDAAPNVQPINAALWSEPGRVDVHQPRPKRTLLTSRFVQPAKDGDVRCLTVDGLGVETCGLLKLDLEGAEGKALQGAVETLRRCRPVLVVEVSDLARRFGWESKDVHRFCLAQGYTSVFREGVNRVYVPD